MIVGELQQCAICQMQVDATLQHDGPRQPEASGDQDHASTFPVNSFNGGLYLTGVQGGAIRHCRILEYIRGVLSKNRKGRKRYAGEALDC